MPIDPEFSKKLNKNDQHNGHDVWGEVKPPEKLGVHGTNVAVDHLSAMETAHQTRNLILSENLIVSTAWHARFSAQRKLSR